MIYYSTEARANMTIAFVVLLSTISLVYALDSGRIQWWVAYAFFTCAAAYTHYTVFFVLFAQFLWGLWSAPTRRRALIIATAAAGVAFLPWLGRFLAGFGQPDGIAYYQPFGLHAIELYIPRWAFGTQYIRIGVVPGYASIVLIVAGLAIGLLGLLLRRLRAGTITTKLSPSGVLIVVLALATPVGAALYSLIGSSVFDPRDLIASWPGWALLIGAVVSNGVAPLRLAAIALVVVGFSFGSAKMLMPANQRPDVASAAAYISRVGYSGEPVVERPVVRVPPLGTRCGVCKPHSLNTEEVPNSSSGRAAT